MKTRRHRAWTSVSLVLVMYWQISAGHAYEIPTHEQLSETAALRSSLDDYLKTWLTITWFDASTQEEKSWGFPNGINEPFQDGKRVLDFVKEGAANEDKPDIRSQHHFHNPRLAWNQAALSWCRPLCKGRCLTCLNCLTPRWYAIGGRDLEPGFYFLTLRPQL
jgi:hypothetical protein